MIRWIAAIPLLLLATSALAQERARLQCLGSGPGFMMVITPDVVWFDYLGDGRFILDPPTVPQPTFGYARRTLVTKRERWTVHFDEVACPMMGISLPVTIEIMTPTSEGPLPMRGCCLWK